jgi:signal transduction histidine kinase
MVTSTILVAAYVGACIWLGVRRMEASGAGPKTPRGRLRELGWGLALLALAIGGFGLGVNRWATLAAMAIAGLVLILRPRLAATLLPVALVGLGIYGFWMVRSAQRAFVFSVQQGGAWPGTGSWWTGPESLWRTTLLLPLAYGSLTAGLWLLWRRVGRRSRLVTTLLAWPVRGRWLLLPVVALLMELLGPNYWLSPNWWNVLWNAVLVILTLILVLCAPAAAADLSAAGLIILGLYGIAVARFWPGGVPIPSAAYAQVKYGAVLVDSRAMATAAGVQGGLLLALGLWLAPRTIVAHARVLLRPEPDAELAGRVEQLTQTRADAVDTAAAELRRVERDLHDGAQARLVALGMNLRAVERLIPTSPQAAIALVAEARETSSRALTELRGLVRGIYPPVLADRGLGDAIRALALDTPLRTETDIDLPGRPDAPVESACYFAVAEALANAVKHSGARLVQVQIRHTAARNASPAPHPSGTLRITVTDDGAGGADPARGTGLAGIERRLGTFDGILAVSSPPGGPTMIVMEVPCALSSPRTSSC